MTLLLLQLRDAIQQVQEAGLSVCLPASPDLQLLLLVDNDDETALFLRETLSLCHSSFSRSVLADNEPDSGHHPQDHHHRHQHDHLWSYLSNALAAAVCVGVAALAAGLTLGLLGLDPLLLLIKERAADSMAERTAASRLLPVVQQHHRLLVTLLLMNAVANEALPLFLEQLVSPAVAVLVSVTLVLFFGEIIPSAIFTGPNQLKIASALVPLVKVVSWLLYPVAGPIAALLDRLLHGHDDDNDGGVPSSSSSAAYTRGELAALIRIQYEERLAVKRKRKQQRKTVILPGGEDHVGALDFSPALPIDCHRQSLRALKNHAAHGRVEPAPVAVGNDDQHWSASVRGIHHPGEGDHTNTDHDDFAPRVRRHSIHEDEVTMMEGALQMQTKVALDVFTPMRRVFSIPSDMKLTERNMVHIYASGYSRIPVHETSGAKHAIVGILVTKMLIVVNPSEARPVCTLPLRTPRCVSPATPLVDLLNLFQSGGHGSHGGHMALVCARPSVGEKALSTPGGSLPETAGLMGIITLEDVLEMLLQEQIYDEMDKRERKALVLATMVFGRWKNYVQRKKQGLLIAPPEEPKLLPIIKLAIATARPIGSDPTAVEEGLASVAETTALLQKKQSNHQQNYSGR